MDARTPELSELIATLARAQNVATLRKCCEHFCAFTETRWFLVGVISARSLVSPNISICSNYPAPWLDSYVSGGRQGVDPVVSYILSENIPVIWSELVKKPEFAQKDHLALMDDAKRHGLHDGLSVPVHTPVGDTAVFSLATDNGAGSARQVLSHAIPYAQLFAIHLVDRYLSLVRIDTDARDGGLFTAREAECLFWACEGKTAWEIARILAIAERTVEFHLTNCAKKLNAANRQHAIALASRHGLIKPTL